MRQRGSKLLLAFGLLVGLTVMGCGDSSNQGVNPKAPAGAPKMQKKMPAGGSGPKPE